MTAKYLVADVFDGLATLADGSVDLVVTSPPFLALRSYLPADDPLKAKEIGSEPTPAAFLDVMLAFTAELRRVLAPHGSIAIELGDTYAGGGGENNLYTSGYSGGVHGLNTKKPEGQGVQRSPNGWPLAKSKTLIPELFRIALAYGINPLTGEPSPAGQWRVRNVVTWARPNPPVGALGDKWRPATSDVVVACVSGKRYWDDLATRRPHVKDVDISTWKKSKTLIARGAAENADGYVSPPNPSGAPLLDYWEIPLLDGEEPTRYGPKDPGPRTHMGGKQIGRTYPKGNDDDPNYRPNYEDRPLNEAGAPLLDYWVIPPGGYEGSHYAVFPPELVVPLVKAMTPERVCRECGEPSRRIVEASVEYRQWREGQMDGKKYGAVGNRDQNWGGNRNGLEAATYDTLGWTDCGHNNYRPGMVCDPFAGSGTTLLVATGHGHDAIGIDLDARNAELALERVGPFLLELDQLANQPDDEDDQNYEHQGTF